MLLDYSYSTIRRRLSALRRLNWYLVSRFIHLLKTSSSPFVTSSAKCMEQRQAVGIDEELFVKMLKTQPATLVGQRNRFLLSVGYNFLARRSEPVAIRTEHLTSTSDSALKGIISRSKIDQHVRGRLVFGSERSAKVPKKWLRQKPTEIQAVFCALNHGRWFNRAICHRQVNEVIKQGLVRVKR